MASRRILTSCLQHVHKQTPRPVVAAQFSTTTTGSSDETYVSPYTDFFERVRQGDNFGLEHIEEPRKFFKCGVAEDDVSFQTEVHGRLVLRPHVKQKEHRVTMKVHLDDTPIKSDLERGLLREIVGTRLREDDCLYIGSNVFGSRIENKRHLVTMLDRIVLGTKRLAAQMEETPPALPASTNATTTTTTTTTTTDESS